VGRVDRKTAENLKLVSQSTFSLFRIEILCHQKIYFLKGLGSELIESCYPLIQKPIDALIREGLSS
jgi:hypothetical protein